jgi:hypothetical protein
VFDRYEVNLYVTNNRGCTKIILFKISITKTANKI